MKGKIIIASSKFFALCKVPSLALSTEPLGKKKKKLHCHKDTRSITQQKPIICAYNFFHKSIHQTSSKGPLFRPPTLTSTALTLSSLNMHKPGQYLNLIYILKFLHHLLPNQHLMPQRALPIANSKSCINYNAINQQHN